MNVRSMTTLAALAALLATAACRDNDPVDAERCDDQQVMDATFSTGLDVDLTLMTETSDGIFFLDGVEGAGDPSLNGDTLGVYFFGYLTDGSVFDAVQQDDPPFTFALGSAGLIPGWNLGILGMKEGGSRRIIIPSELAWGTEGAGGGVIPGCAVVIFDIEVVSRVPS